MDCRALFCILSRFCSTDLLQVICSAELYSRVDRTYPRYSDLKVSLSDPQEVLASFLTSDSLLVAFLLRFSICLFRVSFLSSCTPRYVGHSSLCKD